MKLKGKNIFRVAEAAFLIAVTAVWSVGCSDVSQSAGPSDVQTTVFDADDVKAETFETETEEDHNASTEVPAGDVHLFEREDKINTMFYDLQLDKVKIMDSIGGVTAENGRAFMILDVEIMPCGDELVFSMYARKFLMVCFLGDSVKADSEQDYEKLYPLAEGLAQGQLEEVWLATVGDEKKGKLIYDIPKDAVRTVLLVYDSYTVGYSNETVFGDGYMMSIPMEDWNREN